MAPLVYHTFDVPDARKRGPAPARIAGAVLVVAVCAFVGSQFLTPSPSTSVLTTATNAVGATAAPPDPMPDHGSIYSMPDDERRTANEVRVVHEREPAERFVYPKATNDQMLAGRDATTGQFAEPATTTLDEDGSDAGAQAAEEQAEVDEAEPAPAADEEAPLSAYPGYAGALVVEGTVSVGADGESSLSVAFDMSGLEPSVSGGIHIHSGVTCDDAVLIGGHYYQPPDGEDPWAATYTSDAEGVAVGAVSVESGYSLADVVGHAVVVHSSDGERVACGIIGGGAAADAEAEEEEQEEAASEEEEEEAASEEEEEAEAEEEEGEAGDEPASTA